MPNFDGTGPQGMGSRTGRGMGPCGNGFRGNARYGMGYGYRRFISPRNESIALEEEKKALEGELKVIKEEIDSLKGQEK